MPSVRRELESRINAVLADMLSGLDAEPDPMLKPTQDPKFGDFQANCSMKLAGLLKTPDHKPNPRQIAQQIIDALEVDDICEPPEIAGPGFINLRVKPDRYITDLEAMVADKHLGASIPPEPSTVLVDFSSPNVAKEMHVGHLRSTIIGDCICRVLEFMGHTVHRVNHIGDWGTQFGMLLEYVKQTQPTTLANPEALELGDLEGFYKAAHERFKADDDFKDASRKTVVELQSGDSTMRRLWRAFCDESLKHCYEIYDRLDVKLETVGESAYQDMLPGVVQELRDKKLAVDSEGAVCVFVPGYKTRDDEPLPSIIQKSDGGFNYDTTDLAAVKKRVLELGCNEVIYVTDRGQAQHFQMIFEIGRMAGWVTDDIKLTHIGFGLVLSEDGKRLRSRDGGSVKLKDLLNTAVSRTRALMDEMESKREEKRDLPEEQWHAIAWAVGHAAVKYADLSHNFESDYKFSWDKMITFTGDTGPYMLYAYARISGIGRKAEADYDEVMSSDAPFILDHATELSLGKKLLEFSEVIDVVSKQLRPNLLTSYLYDLSKTFSSFYDAETGVKVKDAETDGLRSSRLKLCGLTRRVLQQGLELLGISVVEEM